MEQTRPTISQVRKAGRVLRDYGSGQRLLDHEAVQEALGVLIAHRRALSQRPYPLTKVTMGLKSMTGTVGVHAEVTQRLKRVDRIIQKLVRFPQMQLDTMEDIGGCRVVVPGLEDLRAVQARIERTWGAATIRTRDYIAMPKSTGYRAVHIVVRREGLPIEVQLRTEVQQRWAKAVEAAETRTRTLLKDGHGDAELLELFRLLAEAFAFIDRGETVPEPLRIAVEQSVDAGRVGPGER
jgi:ppGpp synthetase/RelA/SpoT-type nucleotidyltranferase